MTEAFGATNTISVREAQQRATDEWSITSVSPLRIEVGEAREQRSREAFSNASEAWLNLFVHSVGLFQPRGLPAATLDVTTGKLNSFIQELIRLELDAEEEGLTRPTDYAYKRATQLISDSYVLMWLEELSKYSHLVKPVISTDDLGGVRVAWIHSGRILRANIGARAELRSYLYFEDARVHGVQNLERENLVEKLKWLIP